MLIIRSCPRNQFGINSESFGIIRNHCGIIAESFCALAEYERQHGDVLLRCNLSDHGRGQDTGLVFPIRTRYT